MLFRSKQGNRPTGRDQKGRRGSDEVVPGNSVVPSSETGTNPGSKPRSPVLQEDSLPTELRGKPMDALDHDGDL